MSFLTQILQQVSGSSDSESSSSLGPLLMQLLEKNGGVEGLMGRFSEGGLGDLFSSWVGTGENAAVSADQMKSALGSEQISAVAGQLGVDEKGASGLLSELLPQLVDRMTPDGEIGNANTGSDLIGSVLGGLLGGGDKDPS